MLLTPRSIQSLRRVFTTAIVHPWLRRNSCFELSACFFLLAVACQLPPSTSMASLASGNAKSILNLSHANKGTGFNPAELKAVNSSVSGPLSLPFDWTVLALFSSLSCVCALNAGVDLLASLFTSRSSLDRRLMVMSATSDRDFRGIPNESSHLKITPLVHMNRPARSSHVR